MRLVYIDDDDVSVDWGDGGYAGGAFGNADGYGDGDGGLDGRGCGDGDGCGDYSDPFGYELLLVLEEISCAPARVTKIIPTLSGKVTARDKVEPSFGTELDTSRARTDT